MSCIVRKFGSSDCLFTIKEEICLKSYLAKTQRLLTLLMNLASSHSTSQRTSRLPPFNSLGLPAPLGPANKRPFRPRSGGVYLALVWGCDTWAEANVMFWRGVSDQPASFSCIRTPLEEKIVGSFPLNTHTHMHSSHLKHINIGPTVKSRGFCELIL